MFGGLYSRITHKPRYNIYKVVTDSQGYSMAYCLLGIFGISMPLLYGEGKKAFIRLQEEIIKSSADPSILVWDPISPEPQSRGMSSGHQPTGAINPAKECLSPLLAESPKCFRGCRDVLLSKDTSSFGNSSLTGYGLSLDLITMRSTFPQLVFANLECYIVRNKRKHDIWIALYSVSNQISNAYVRVQRPVSKLFLAESRASLATKQRLLQRSFILSYPTVGEDCNSFFLLFLKQLRTQNHILCFHPARFPSPRTLRNIGLARQKLDQVRNWDEIPSRGYYLESRVSDLDIKMTWWVERGTIHNLIVLNKRQSVHRLYGFLVSTKREQYRPRIALVLGLNTSTISWYSTQTRELLRRLLALPRITVKNPWCVVSPEKMDCIIWKGIEGGGLFGAVGRFISSLRTLNSREKRIQGQMNRLPISIDMLGFFEWSVAGERQAHIASVIVLDVVDIPFWS